MEFQLIQQPMRWVFLLHILGGITALSIFLVPLLTKKGGKVHVKTGWLYVIAMVVVSLTAYIITPWRGFWDPNRTSSSIKWAAFLFFIATFGVVSVWHGLTALKFKKRITGSTSLSHIGPPLALILLGIGVQILGIFLKDPLLTVFPFFSFFTGKSYLDYWRKPPATKMSWWYAHMDGMFTACIATVTAFLVTAVPRFWHNPLAKSPVVWIAPGIIMGTVLSRWLRFYRVKFNERELPGK